MKTPLKTAAPTRGMLPPEAASPASGRRRRAVTLVETLLAMALTLLMMAAVVSIFANVSSSVTNRRATIELAGQIRNVRGVLQRDLAGATCPAIPWQRPESNHGYFEIVEGQRSDFDPSVWLQDINNDGRPDDIDGTSGPLESLDLATSSLPSSNLAQLPGATTLVTSADANAATDGRGLGDWDDILMLTVRNEDEPFVGRVPAGTFVDSNNNGVKDFGNGSNESDTPFVTWGRQPLESTLAEVVWYSVENPVEPSDSPTFYFGEPGFRTIYRRVLLIAPQLNYRFTVGTPGEARITGPGVVRVLRAQVSEQEVDQALAALIAFQERYDLSVRLEWDPTLGADGRWTIVANTLADLTKRENRYEHFGYLGVNGTRVFPFVMASAGRGQDSSTAFAIVTDEEYRVDRNARAQLAVADTDTGAVIAYRNEGLNNAPRRDPDGRLAPRPFVYASGGDRTAPTCRAIVNEEAQIVGLTTGLVPLSGARRGEDVMLTSALAFDVRVLDPEAPLVRRFDDRGTANPADDEIGETYQPGDAGWGAVVATEFEPTENGPMESPLGNMEIVGRGAYVDLGYYRVHRDLFLKTPVLAADFAAWPTLPDENSREVGRRFVGSSPLAGVSADPQLTRLEDDRSGLRSATGTDLDPYRTYDTWSFHYENNGVDEDAVLDTLAGIPLAADEGIDGFDSTVFYDDNNNGNVDAGELDQRFGPDDISERETAPPYDVRLRAVRVTLRAYEPDSRQIREVKVSQTFVPQ